MGKIYVRMGGRLGNQLFRYAAARYIQELHRNGEDKDELVLDFSSVYKEGKAKPNESGFENSLQYFKTQSYKLEWLSRRPLLFLELDRDFLSRFEPLAEYYLHYRLWYQ